MHKQRDCPLAHSRSPRRPEPFDLSPRTELKTLLRTIGFQPRSLFGQGLDGYALRHEHYPGVLDLGKLGQISLDLAAVLGPVDDELPLAIVLGRQAANHLRRVTVERVTPGPPRIALGRRRRVRQFRADRHQIAADRQVERAGSLDRDVPTSIAKAAPKAEAVRQTASARRPSEQRAARRPDRPPRHARQVHRETAAARPLATPPVGRESRRPKTLRPPASTRRRACRNSRSAGCSRWCARRGSPRPSGGPHLGSNEISRRYA